MIKHLKPRSKEEIKEANDKLFKEFYNEEFKEFSAHIRYYRAIGEISNEDMKFFKDTINKK